jgi:hypothetical protein
MVRDVRLRIAESECPGGAAPRDCMEVLGRAGANACWSEYDETGNVEERGDSDWVVGLINVD